MFHFLSHLKHKWPIAAITPSYKNRIILNLRWLINPVLMKQIVYYYIMKVYIKPLLKPFSIVR